MTKSSILDWDPSASWNTDVGGINIAEGCAAANINNAMREMMAQVKSGVDYKAVQATKSGAYTAVLTDNNAVHRFTDAGTVTLTAAATLGADWHYTVHAYSGDRVIDPNESETINGATTITVPSGSSALIYCTGTAFFAIVGLSLASATSDNTLADTDEFIYLSGSTVKRGTLSGTVDSIFDGARTITNGRFFMSSFRLWNADQTFRYQFVGSPTANRNINLPDGNVTVPTGTLAAITDVQSWTNVSVALAALTANSVGALAFARRTTGTAEVQNGATIAGSSLTPAGVLTVDSTALSGTWRCLGYVGSGTTSANSGTIYVRIS